MAGVKSYNCVTGKDYFSETGEYIFDIFDYVKKGATLLLSMFKLGKNWTPALICKRKRFYIET